MKSKVTQKKDNFGGVAQDNNPKSMLQEASKKVTGGKEPPMELLHRLAMGEKQKVSLL